MDIGDAKNVRDILIEANDDCSTVLIEVKNTIDYYNRANRVGDDYPKRLLEENEREIKDIIGDVKERLNDALNEMSGDN